MLPVLTNRFLSKYFQPRQWTPKFNQFVEFTQVQASSSEFSVVSKYSKSQCIAKNILKHIFVPLSCDLFYAFIIIQITDTFYWWNLNTAIAWSKQITRSVLHNLPSYYSFHPIGGRCSSKSDTYTSTSHSSLKFGALVLHGLLLTNKSIRAEK